SRPQAMPTVLHRQRAASFDRDVPGLSREKSVVAAPFEADGPALVRGREKSEKRVGRNRGMKLGAEDLLSVILADEIGDDVARENFAHVVDAKTRFHLVLDERLNLDDLPAFGLGRDVDKS